jgi:hypothetical protein
MDTIVQWIGVRANAPITSSKRRGSQHRTTRENEHECLLPVLRISLVGLAMLGMLSSATSGGAQSVSVEETMRSVARMLERLPYYGVFDYIVFRVDRGTVYLAGYSFEGRLKADAGNGRDTGERRRRSGQQDRGAARVAKRRPNPMGDFLLDLH